MKGKTTAFERRSLKDPTTGMEVIRLTDNRAIYDRPYFTSPQFSPDGRYTIFVSDFSGTSRVANPDAPAIGKLGFGELFLLDMETGKAMQLTEGEAIKMGHGAHAMLRPDGKKAYYYSNEWVKEVDVETLEERRLMRIPSTFNFHSLTAATDNSSIAFSVVEEIPLLTAMFTDPLSGSAPGARERYFNQPRSHVIRYDLNTNKGEIVFGGHYRLTHVSIDPTNSDTMVYCHDGPWYQVQRMWVAHVKGDNVEPLVVQQKYLEAVGHEFFTPTGRVGAQYSYRYRPDMKFFLFADLFIDPDGKNQERFYYPYRRTQHVSVGPNPYLGVGDVAALSADMPVKEANRYLSLVEYNQADHRAEVSILCEHNTSGKKSAHVHPVFTPDGSRVVYSSDCEGSLNIYTVEADIGRTVRKL